MKMQSTGACVISLVLCGCATTTSDWAVIEADSANEVLVVSEQHSNRAKARRTALLACESKGYGVAVQLTSITDVAQFECQPYEFAQRPKGYLGVF